MPQPEPPVAPEFRAWPKTPRLYREMVITEKIDGTNAAIICTEDGGVHAQSRKRLITPDDDNFGFAKWVDENADDLYDALGPGHHYGEWWGLGIQRGYGQSGKRLSLFNVSRYGSLELPDGVDVVPVLYSGGFDTSVIDSWVGSLRVQGSMAAPGQPAEGVVVFHTASRSVYKVLCENDGIPKGQGSG